MPDQNDHGALTPDAAKLQIAANYSDPEFIKAYANERARGHAEAVAEMARLYTQAYPPGAGTWPPLVLGVQQVAQTLGVSIGRAGSLICKACAQKDIRSFHLTGHEPMLADWRDGQINTRGDLVNGNHRFEGVHLSGDDLARWLDDLTPGASSTPKRPARGTTAGRRAHPTWDKGDEEIKRWLEDNGCPAKGDGEQAQLETHIATFLAELGAEPSIATIRRHVVDGIKKYREQWAATPGSEGSSIKGS